MSVISLDHFGVDMPQLLCDNFQRNTQSYPSTCSTVSQLVKSETFNLCKRAGAPHWFLLAIFEPRLATLAQEHGFAQLAIGTHFPEKSDSFWLEVYVSLLTAFRFNDEEGTGRSVELAHAQPAQLSIPGSSV